jgi:hypothetical protein
MDEVEDLLLTGVLGHGACHASRANGSYVSTMLTQLGPSQKNLTGPINRRI